MENLREHLRQAMLIKRRSIYELDVENLYCNYFAICTRRFSRHLREIDGDLPFVS